MLNRLRPSTAIPNNGRAPAARTSSLSHYRESLRSINWKLIVFCVALWWFIYSAPTEGILSSHFWAASTATNADDF